MTRTSPDGRGFVVHVVQCSPDDQGGTARRLAAELDDVPGVVFCPRKGFRPRRRNFGSSKIYEVLPRQPHTVWTTALFLLVGLPVLIVELTRLVVGDIPIKIVHSHNPDSFAILGRLASRFLRVPRIHEVHRLSPKRSSWGSLRNHVAQRSLGTPEAVIAQSRSEIRELSDWIPSHKIHHIPTGYWLSQYVPRKPNAGNGPYRVVAPFTSDFDDKLGFSLAVNLLNESERGSICLLGKPAHCVKMSQELGLKYLGYLSSSDYLDLLMGSEIVFVGRLGFSAIPTTPTRLTEALWAGKFVVLHQSDSARLLLDYESRQNVLTYCAPRSLSDHFRRAIAGTLPRAATVDRSVECFGKPNAYSELVSQVTHATT